MKTKTWVHVLLALTLGGAILSGCGGDAASESLGNDEIQVIEVGTRWASAKYPDATALIEASDAVFVGRVTRLVGQREEPMGRIGPDPNQETLPGGKPTPRNTSSKPFPMSLYEVSVDASLSGLQEVASVIVEQAGGLTTNSDGTQVILVLEDDELLLPDHTYLFFAQRSESDQSDFLTSPLTRLELQPDGKFKTVAPWQYLDSLREFSGLSIGQVSERIASLNRDAS